MKKALVLATVAVFVFAVAFVQPHSARAYYTQDLVVNGGFEADPLGTGWTQTPSGLIGAWTSLTSWHGGIRGAFLGGANSVYDILGQAKAIPANATSAILTYWYQWGTSETNMSYCYDYAKVEVLNLFDPTEIAGSSTLCSNGATNWGTWSRVDVDVTSLKGKTAYFRFIVSTDASFDSGLIIDDVSLVIEKPDTTAPTTNLSASPGSPNGSNSFYTTIPTLTLSVSDDIGGSGVNKPYYTWDSGILIPYVGPFAALEGTHTLSYISSDVAGNAEVVKTALFKVDATKPILTLVGSGSVTIEAGSAYTDSGVSATDNLDGAIVSRISTTNTVNTALVGTYTVTYNVSDEAGNAATAVTRTVQVVDSTKPIITILGSNPVTVEKNSAYTDAGATATDSASGDITSKITTTSTVNTALVGNYSVTYTVADSSGNVATAERIVKVISKGRVLGVETALPVITNLKQSNSKYSLFTLAGKTVKVQPFDKSYKGKIWAKRINFGEGAGSLYLFAPTDTYAKSTIKVYGPDGKLIKTVKPFGGFSTSGFNLDIVVEPLNDIVYLAVGTRKAGTTAVVYEVSSTGLKFVSSVKAGKTAGKVMVKFLSLYTSQYGLVTAVNGSRSILKVWKYNSATNKFTQDKMYSLKTLKVSGNTIKLK